jgi:sortase (surface protein transpeptidase)
MVVHGGLVAGPVGPATEITDAPAKPVSLGPPPGTARSTALPRSDPVHLDIPAVEIHTPLTPLGLNADRTMATPPLTRTAPAGWYRYLATPGEIGTAVIVGHVDSARFGPAVFFRLGTLRPGDAIAVRRTDGRTVQFTVVAVVRYAKSRFPTNAVYSQASYPALRLVTCGGTFDRRSGHYRDVVVVYAVAVQRRPSNPSLWEAAS